MEVATYVGEREVVAEGTLVLGGGDSTATIWIENIAFLFAFAPRPLPPTVGTDNPTGTSIRFTIAGALAGPHQWWFPVVGTIQGKNISLSFVAQQYSALPDRPIGLKLDYTFTAGPGSSEGLLR